MSPKSDLTRVVRCNCPASYLPQTLRQDVVVFLTIRRTSMGHSPPKVPEL